MRKRMLRSFATLLFVIILNLMAFSAGAQQGGTTTYVYDDNGRLHAVISPTGEAAVYDYDAAGNITTIRRIAASTLAILAFSPHAGLPGDQVTLTGVGFGAGVSEVSFNGAPAVVASVTPSRVVVTVPPSATTGVITITTPNGSVSTAIPFTIAGLRITPSSAAVKFGESIQFFAEVLPSTQEQDVQWSVNDINGGNTTVGSISSTGVYTAPDIRYSSVTIRATSITDAERFGEAQVRVSDPLDVQSVFAAPVSVIRGENSLTAPMARQVSVQYGVLGNSAAISKAVAVQYGLLGEPQSALSKSLAVQYGDVADGVALSRSVSVQRGTSEQTTAISVPVSVTSGPFIQSLTPGNITRGTTVTLTLNGIGFSGATALRFITGGSTIDTGVTASNIVIGGDGTSLTATVTVTAGAAPGNHTVLISTPNGDSIIVNLGINIVNLQ